MLSCTVDLCFFVFNAPATTDISTYRHTLALHIALPFLIRERTMAGLAAARARGREGGRKFALSKAQVRLAQAAMAQRDTSVSDLCKELGIERVTLYRY